MDVADAISKVKTNPKDDKPYEEIKIINVSLKGWNGYQLLQRKTNNELMNLVSLKNKSQVAFQLHSAREGSKKDVVCNAVQKERYKIFRC